MIRRPPRSTPLYSSAASDVYKRQHWGDSSARDHYRIAWRAMAANTGERTLIPAIIPPGTAHPNGVFSSGSATITGRPLVAAQASLSSLLADFTLRALPKSGIYFPDFSRLPALPHNHPLTTRVVLRALRLNCVTNAYADLWAKCWNDSFVTCLLYTSDAADE